MRRPCSSSLSTACSKTMPVSTRPTFFSGPTSDGGGQRPCPRPALAPALAALAPAPAPSARVHPPPAPCHHQVSFRRVHTQRQAGQRCASKARGGLSRFWRAARGAHPAPARDNPPPQDGCWSINGSSTASAAPRSPAPTAPPCGSVGSPSRKAPAATPSACRWHGRPHAATAAGPRPPAPSGPPPWRRAARGCTVAGAAARTSVEPLGLKACCMSNRATTGKGPGCTSSSQPQLALCAEGPVRVSWGRDGPSSRCQNHWPSTASGPRCHRDSRS